MYLKNNLGVPVVFVIKYLLKTKKKFAKPYLPVHMGLSGIFKAKKKILKFCDTVPLKCFELL